jgi:prepilin-type N-terminal cleavage/methylation domain-containing protein
MVPPCSAAARVAAPRGGRFSPWGGPSAKVSAGFTLLELLLVLVLVGIGTGLAMVSVDQLAGRAEERRWLDRTQQELKRLRNRAVLGGAPVEATVHFASGRIATATGNVLELPERYRFITSAERRPGSTAARSEDEALQLRFYPDGTMQEAAFLVRTPTGVQQQFHMARISGRIERHDVAPTEPQ